MQRIERSVRVKAPASRVYELWRGFERFPTFMESVHEVRMMGGDGRRSHWRITGPLGKEVEFDAETTEDKPNKSIGWRSIEGQGDIGVSGNVTFSELDDNETLVHVVMQWFDTPAGAIGEAASRALQNPEKMLEDDLRRFKDVAEGRMPYAA
jgi:uncharacterized membrane protein